MVLGFPHVLPVPVPTANRAEWNPPEPIGNLIDTWYFGRALEAMAREVEADRLTVYLTFDTEILPSYGDDVVVILIGDEWARLPAYLPRVRAVFRNLCSRPNLGCRPLAWPSPVTLSALLPAGGGHPRRPGAASTPARRAGRGTGRGRPLAPQVEVPIGTYNLLDLPLKPLAQRGPTCSSPAAWTTRPDASPG